MTRTERAAALHAGGSACSQSVFCVFAGDFGLDEALAHRLATGLGGGCGRKQYLCGAVSGAVLVLGLAFGSETGAGKAAKEECYAKVHAFIEAIEAEYGSSECKVLLEGADLMSPEGQAYIKGRGLGAKVCGPVIGRCVEMLEEILDGRPAGAGTGASGAA